MDPTATLEELRRLLAQKYPDTEDMLRAQDLFKALDHWLSAKNFLPKAWTPAPELHFDSSGLVHGPAGYAAAMKDPWWWDARGNPDGFWVGYLVWRDWDLTDERKSKMSFRRATDAKSITHEELNK
jgi:hypothetical protein